ncbi:MAG TPA: hypothetical protein VF910_03515 [Candidatus Bathyarchaeia archaeon]
MTLIGSSELSPNRPFFLVYLLPLIVEAAIIVSFVTGFVSVDSGFGPYGPSYGFPFAYRTTYCELLPCAYFLDWSVFWVDVIFYVGLQYILIIFYGAHIGKFPRPSLSQLQDARLAFPFGLALFACTMMISAPLFTVPSTHLADTVCLDPSPCLTRQNYYRSIWNLIGTIWTFSAFITLFVGLMIGLVGNLGREFMGAVLVGLAGVYISGVEILLTSGVTTYLNLSSMQVLEIAFSLSIAPLLVFLSALILVTNRIPFTFSRNN